jgi:shikimate dehydrogenase
MLHNAWLAAAGIDGVYIALSPAPERLATFIDGLRGGVFSGLNVTVPYKEQALALADTASDRAYKAGAANLLTFAPDGAVRADNTDGYGLLAAFAAQAPGFKADAAPIAILGAGGAARGAAAAFLEAGSPAVRLINRTLGRAEAVAEGVGGSVETFGWADAKKAFEGAGALINATTLGLVGGEPLEIDLDGLPHEAIVMDMVYRPLRTALAIRASARGHRIVDGLEMLIHQAEPSFEAFFGQSPPASLDVRALAVAALEHQA